MLVDPSRQLEHGRRLFTTPLFLRERFTAVQLEQGFWFLSHVGISDVSDFFADQLWNPEAPVDARIAAIAAMYDLFEQLFAPFPAETATNMWWDLLSGDLDHGRFTQGGPPGRERIRLAMVDTLARILRLDARHCQEAALHGLDHIATPQERAALIDPFLQRPRDEKLLAYARECRAGRAQ